MGKKKVDDKLNNNILQRGLEIAELKEEDMPMV